MSKPRTIQAAEGARQAPVKQILLEIIANRTGAVSSDEIYGALVNGWELPKVKQDPRRWVAAMLADIARLEFIKRTGTHCKPIICKSGKTGTASLAMYDIAPDGAAFLTAGGGVVPKYRPPPPPIIDDDGSLIPRNGLSARIASLLVPQCNWRNGKPAAAHMGVQA